MNYTAEDFHLHYIPSYSLYIQSDFQYDHIVVLDQEKNVVVYMSYDNLMPSTEAVKLLSLPFQKVIIGLPHQSLVWVPAEVYDPTEKSLYLDYFVEADTEHILEKDIPGLKLTALYQYDRFLFNKWYSLFPDATFVPNFEVILLQAKSKIPIQGEVFGVHIYDNQADIFLFVNGEIRLYNTFEIATADDLSYFILNVFKNFSIEGKVQKILLSGAAADSEWALRLSYYTDQLDIVKSKDKWHIAQDDINNELAALNVLIDSTLCV